MCAIYKKELRAYLTSMTGYIFMAVLLAVTSLYYVANCLVGGYPVFGAILSSVYFVLLIIVPVLTMRSMAEEKRQKTDQLLMTAPVSLWKIVLSHCPWRIQQSWATPYLAQPVWPLDCFCQQ